MNGNADPTDPTDHHRSPQMAIGGLTSTRVTKPPLVLEIERLERELGVEQRSDVLDFDHIRYLRGRLSELRAWAWKNGWSTLPDDDRPPPAAPAAAAERIAA